MQMCESRLQLSPILALQSSVLQDSGGKRKQDASLSSPLIRCAPDVHCGIFYFQCSSRAVTVTGHRGNACMTFVPHLTLQSANSPVSIVVITSGEDTYKVMRVKYIQEMCRENDRSLIANFRRLAAPYYFAQMCHYDGRYSTLEFDGTIRDCA